MDHSRLEQHIRWSKWTLGIVVAITIGRYAATFQGQPLSGDPALWGQFGDYLGGVMNPLIAFGAFYWVATSVLLQKTELAETRKALLESQKAQQKQAEMAVIAAKIQTLNIRLNSIVSQLANARARQATLLSQEDGGGKFATAIDPKGERHFVLPMLRNVKAKIEQLEELETNLLEQVETLGDIVMPPPLTDD